MNRTIRGGLLVVLCLVVVAGLVLTGCGKKEKALQQPDLEFTQYIKGSTVDFDETTMNTMADSGGEGGFKYGLMKTIYYTLWDTNKDAVAQALYPAPYWRGDGVQTLYSYLTSADQTAVDTYIFGNYIPGKGLSAAEQAVVTTAVEGFFARQQIDVSNAKALTATSFYQTLVAKVGQTAADGWKADIEAMATAIGGKAYADLTSTQKQYVIAVADPIGLFYKWMAGSAVYGEMAFKNGVAASTYPTQAEDLAKSMKGKAYSALDPVTEAPYVNGAVYAGLASGFANDAARDAARAYTASSMKAAGYVTSDNYSALNYVEKARVDMFLYGSLTFGSAKERDYIDLAGVTGAMLKFVAEMSDAVPIEQSMCYLKLNGQSCYFMPPNQTGVKVSYPTTTAAKGFKTDVEAGVKLETAFYRWLAKEKVKETASAASLIQQSVGEFYFTITNPNKYEIKIDQIVFAFQTTAGTSTIDGARQTVDSIYVPAEGEVSLKVVAPTKVYDLLSWLTIAGQGANARAYAAQVWSKIQAGTITWTFTAEMKVSHGDEIENYSYPV